MSIIPRTQPRTRPGYLESVGRITLAALTLVLGAALAAGLAGTHGAVTAVVLLAPVGWAVVWPERPHPEVAALAWKVALGVVVAALLSSLIFGSILAALGYAAALAGIALVLSPLLYVGPKDRR